MLRTTPKPPPPLTPPPAGKKPPPPVYPQAPPATTPKPPLGPPPPPAGEKPPPHVTPAESVFMHVCEPDRSGGQWHPPVLRKERAIAQMLGVSHDTYWWVCSCWGSPTPPPACKAGIVWPPLPTPTYDAVPTTPKCKGECCHNRRNKATSTVAVQPPTQLPYYLSPNDPIQMTQPLSLLHSWTTTVAIVFLLSPWRTLNQLRIPTKSGA